MDKNNKRYCSRREFTAAAVSTAAFTIVPRRVLGGRGQELLHPRAVKADFQIEGRKIQSVRVFEIADDPMVEVSLLNSADVMRVAEKAIGNAEPWEFPAASVSAVELKL